MSVMAYEQSLDGQMACGPGDDDDDLSDLSMGDMSDFEADDQHDAHGSHGGRWSLPSQGTSRLTKSSGKDVQVFERRFRSGVPPRVPTYDGNRDPAVINRWKKKVRIWKRLASPYLPLPEMGLRLHDDGLTGRAAEIVHEEDDEDKDFCSEGCELVVKRVLYHSQEDDMVELGDRLDTFFDKLRRHAGETLLEYTNRFDRNYRPESTGCSRDLDFSPRTSVRSSCMLAENWISVRLLRSCDSIAGFTGSILATAQVNVSARAQVSIVVSNDRRSGLRQAVALRLLEDDATG